MFQCSSLNSSHPLLPPLCLQVCVSISALQVCSSEPSLEIPYICVNIYSLSDLFHSVLKALSSLTSLELSQMHSLLWLWVIPFNWYKKGTIFLPWRIVNMLILVDCVFSWNVNPSLIFMMSCSSSRGLRTFWFSFSSGLCSGRCSVLSVTAHCVIQDIWLSPRSKGRTAIRWCQPLPSKFHLTESVTLIVS